MPKFSDNPPAQHEIVEKNDLLLANTSAAAPNSNSGCSGSGGLNKKVTEKDICDTKSSEDASSAPSKSNGHASGTLEDEKVSPFEEVHVVYVFLSIV